MSVDASFNNDNTVYTMSIRGDFNFLLLNDFRNAYSNEDIKSNMKVIVDLRNTDTIDSSALGMLLNMQRYLNRPDGNIEIVNANDTVLKIFKITHFEKKFKID